MIRLLRPSDIEACTLLVKENYDTQSSVLAKAELAEMFGKSPIRPTYVVFEQNESVIGFAGFIVSWMDYNVWSIFWVNVKPRFQRLGVGKRLVADVIRRIKEKDADCVTLVTNSPRYYNRHFGFRTLAIIQNNSGENRLMGLLIGSRARAHGL